MMEPTNNSRRSKNTGVTRRKLLGQAGLAGSTQAAGCQRDQTLNSNDQSESTHDSGEQANTNQRNGNCQEIECLQTNRINEVTIVKNGPEFAQALNSESRIRFGSSISIEEPIKKELGGRSVFIDLNGFTLRKADGVNGGTLWLTGDGHMTVRNGFIDCNRSGQDFPNEKHKEVRFRSSQSSDNIVRISDVTLFDNTNFGFEVQDVFTAVFNNTVVNSHPEQIKKQNCPGIDGIHTFDCQRVAISNPVIKSGDDSIAISAYDIEVDRITVQGGTLSSPVHASGFKLNVQRGATESAKINNVRLDTHIQDCRGQGIIFINESSNETVIEDVSIDGVITNVGAEGFNARIPLYNIDIQADFRSVGMTDNRPGINLRGGTNLCRISSTIDTCADHGINAEDANNVTVTGSIIRDCEGRPINLKGNSDYWTVTGNRWFDNEEAKPKMSGENNVVGMNNTDN